MIATPPVFETRGLGKVWPDGRRALEDVELEVRSGEFLVVIGLSGSGKSTLLRCLNRLVDPTEGTVAFEGEDVTRVRGRELRELRSRAAMIFQRFHLVPRATALANVLSGALLRTPTTRTLLGWWTRAERAEAMERLSAVGLADVAHKRADRLSGGQQQRVAIARALMQRPVALLADEPVASLDPATSHSVMDHLKRLQVDEGRTVVASLHFLSLAREYGTRVVALRAGRIVFEGAPGGIDRDRFREIYGEDAAEVEVR